MRKTIFLSSKSLHKKNTEYKLLSEPHELFKAFSVLITALTLTYISIVHVINFDVSRFISQVLSLLPLLLSIALLFSVYQKAISVIRLIVISYLLILLIGIVLYGNEITYPKALMLPAFVLLFFDKSKQEQIWNGIYLCITYVVVQIRFYMSELREVGRHLLLFEIISIAFGIAVFIVCNWIKKEFLHYEDEIKQRTLKLEQKNHYLEDLVSLNEKKKDQLKRTLLLKEKLMAILSHDIRTPINSFNLLISNFEKGYIPDKLFIEGIVETKQELINIDKLVVDLLSWSREGNEENTGHLMTCEEYKEISQFALSLYNLSAKNKKLEIVSTVKMPKAMSLSISKREIEIILRNTLSNAIKFSKPGGKIIVSLQVPKTENGVAILSIKDFGVGMPLKKMEQLNSSQLTSTLGTLDEVGIGIGLSIVLDVLNSNNLQYRIESNENEGTEFSVKIPLINC